MRKTIKVIFVIIFIGSFVPFPQRAFQSFTLILLDNNKQPIKDYTILFEYFEYPTLSKKEIVAHPNNIGKLYVQGKNVWMNSYLRFWFFLLSNTRGGWSSEHATINIDLKNVNINQNSISIARLTEKSGLTELISSNDSIDSFMATYKVNNKLLFSIASDYNQNHLTIKFDTYCSRSNIMNTVSIYLFLSNNEELIRKRGNYGNIKEL